MFTTINKKCVMLFSSFTKQLAIADINLTLAFLEEVKHHWGSFLVPEMIQKKLHRVAVSNVDAKVKVRWFKFWNGNRFDKDVLHFPKSLLFDSALDDWSSILNIGYSWKKILLRSFIVFFPLIFNYQQICLLSPSISKLGSLRLSFQYSIVNSKTGK